MLIYMGLFALCLVYDQNSAKFLLLFLITLLVSIFYSSRYTIRLFLFVCFYLPQSLWCLWHSKLPSHLKNFLVFGMIILLSYWFSFFLLTHFTHSHLTSLLNVWSFTLTILLPSKFDLFLLISYLKLTCAIISDYHNFRNNQYWIPSLECYFQLTDFLNAISNCNTPNHSFSFISFLCFVSLSLWRLKIPNCVL